MKVASTAVGLASAKVRDAHGRARARTGRTRRRVLDAMDRCRAITSSIRRWPAAPTRIRRCRSVSDRRSLNHTSSRARELALKGCQDPSEDEDPRVGTGCGYAAAVLAQLVGEPWSVVERVRALHELARDRSCAAAHCPLRLVFGDGSRGVERLRRSTRSSRPPREMRCRQPWVEQLENRQGRIVAPVGSDEQQLVVDEGRKPASWSTTGQGSGSVRATAWRPRLRRVDEGLGVQCGMGRCMRLLASCGTSRPAAGWCATGPERAPPRRGRTNRPAPRRPAPAPRSRGRPTASTSCSAATRCTASPRRSA